MANKLPWFRLFHECRTDKKLNTLTHSERYVWLNLLCFASEQDLRGCIYYTDDFNLSIEVSDGDVELLNQTVDKLIKLRILSDDKDDVTSGHKRSQVDICDNAENMKVLHFINFNKRQESVQYPSWSKEKSNERKQKSRNNTKIERENDMSQAVTSESQAVTSGHKQNKIENKNIYKEKEYKEKESCDEYSTEFETFWKTYPRKYGKKLAYKNWNARLKEKVSVDDLLIACKNYTKDVELKGTEERFIMQPTTFLGPNERWKDYFKSNTQQEPQKPKRTNEEKDYYLAHRHYPDETEKAKVCRLCNKVS